MPAIAADSAANPVAYIDVILGYGVEAGRTVLATNHAAPAANTAWRAMLLGYGDF